MTNAASLRSISTLVKTTCPPLLLCLTVSVRATLSQFRTVVSPDGLMDGMKAEWTKDERRLFNELRESMDTMKGLIAKNAAAQERQKSAAELQAAAMNDREIEAVVELALKKEGTSARLAKLLGRIRAGNVALPASQRTIPARAAASIPLPDAVPSVTAAAAAAIPKPARAAGRVPTAGLEWPAGNGPGSDPDKMAAVVTEFKHAWRAYEKYAWGMDVVKPIARRGHNEQYKMGITLLDSLDTLWLMGLHEKFDKAVGWVRDSCVFSRQEVSVFETTIRGLGGLLAAYHLSGERVLLTKAKELADKMHPAFDTPTGFPRSTVRLSDGKAWCPSGDAASFSEVASLTLEWGYLSRLTGDDKYQRTQDKIIDTMVSMPKINGLYAQWVSVTSGRFTSGDITLGSRVDSAYEYLEKLWRFGGRSERRVWAEYLARVDDIERHLIKKSKPNGLTYIQQCGFGMRHCHGQFDHLVCFAPAMLALGALDKENPKAARHMQLAKEITHTCNEAYRRMPTGLAPEIIKFDRGDDFFVEHADTHNLLRPETVESLFVMWRVTHDQKYRDWGWSIFKAFREWTKVDGAGYSSINSVKISSKSQRSWRDKTESFFFAETMKYFYLLFTDDTVLPLEDYVFNTEAHAFPIAMPTPV